MLLLYKQRKKSKSMEKFSLKNDRYENSKATLKKLFFFAQF